MSGSPPRTVARPQQQGGGPTFMQRPMQGYQAPARTVDYSYQPQSQAPRQIQSPQWAIPKFPVPEGFGLPGYDPYAYAASDIYNNPGYGLPQDDSYNTPA